MLIASLAVTLGTAAYGLMSGQTSVAALYGIGALLAFGPRLVQKAVPSWQSDDRTERIEYYLFFVLLFNALGTSFLHKLPYQYDRWLHFASGYCAIMIAVAAFAPKEAARPKSFRAIALPVTLTLLAFVAVEVGQFTGDTFFGTMMFHDVGQDIARDVVEDMTFNLLGAALALHVLHRRKP